MMFSGISRWRVAGMLPSVVFIVPGGFAVAQNPPAPRYPISKADVAKEVSSIGVTVDTSQVHIPSGISAASTSPDLEIVTSEPVGNDQVRLQLRCSTTAECLPFFAMLDIKGASLTSAEIRRSTNRTAAVDEQKIFPVNVAREGRPKIEVGSRAMLIIRDGHLDIHLQVLAIDTGVLGQQVRVSTLDRKKMFRATVTGEGTVTGSLE